MNLKMTSIDAIVQDKEPITCSAETQLTEALKLMQENKVGSIIITDSDKVCGIFTERDLLNQQADLSEKNFFKRPIHEFMTKDVKTVTSETTVHQCLVTMRLGKFRHIVITDENSKLKAVLSIRDALNFLCDKIVYKDVI